MTIESYFDESGDHDGSAALTVAGFAFERDHARLMRNEWGDILARHNLPFLHMADFAPGNGPYKHLGVSERIAIQIELQAVLYRHAAFGLAVSARASEQQDLYQYNANCPNAFTLCCQICLAMFADWMSFKGHSNKNAAFFFESGNRYQSDADRIMRQMCAQRPDISTSFVGKQAGGGPIQAADLLAWLQNKYIKSRIFGDNKMRADLKALTRNVECVGVVLRGFGQSSFIDLITDYQDGLPLSSSLRLTGTFGGTGF